MAKHDWQAVNYSTGSQIKIRWGCTKCAAFSYNPEARLPVGGCVEREPSADRGSK